MKIKSYIAAIMLFISTIVLGHSDESGMTYAKEGFYIGTELGGTVVPDIDLGSYDAGFGTDVSAKVDLNPGIRFDLPLGYRVNEWFSMEFAPGVMWNSFNALELSAGSAEASVNLSGNYIQVPLLVNFILTIPTNSKWEPYFGGGIGGLFSYLNVTEIYSISAPENSGTSWALGYSAIAGLNYHISRDMSFGFNYKFTGTGTQNWTGDYDGLSTNVYTHSASLSATFRF